MANKILFYDVSIKSPVRTTKCFAPNTLYDYPSFIKLITETDTRSDA